MLDHDDTVGSHARLCLTSLGIAENTIVMYSTDNGPHMNPAGPTPTSPCSDNEKINCRVRPPCPGAGALAGTHPAGSALNGIVSHAVALGYVVGGAPDIAERLRAGTADETTYKVHLDGYMIGVHHGRSTRALAQPLRCLRPRSLRRRDWKFVFLESVARAPATWASLR